MTLIQITTEISQIVNQDFISFRDTKRLEELLKLKRICAIIAKINLMTELKGNA